MKNLLVINPNTSASVSQLLQWHAQKAAGTLTTVRVATARLGAPYIACEGSYAVGAYAAMDAWAEAEGSRGNAPFDAVLIGCFGDPGLFALRDQCQVPVTGLAEASLLEASRSGAFVIVTGGEKWKPILTRLASNLGLADGLAAVETVAPSGALLASNPTAAHALLADACAAAVERHKVQTVILGGAGLAGMAAAIQHRVPVPVIDSVHAGVRHACALMSTQAIGGPVVAPHFEFAWSGVTPALGRLGRSDAMVAGGCGHENAYPPPSGA